MALIGLLVSVRENGVEPVARRNPFGMGFFVHGRSSVEQHFCIIRSFVWLIGRK
ncbi:hypothetical protein ABQW55_010840 [Xanthomonas citri pv. malvacearum]|uniref:hypothetical protein n=1 Tax=Xanthomonas citri TaxID=346 RepID=UPI001E64B7AA|nr:hypothetical protein [Xanthomonas citri]WAW89302.1 hypothetical protein LPY96_11510 [Xanthomonas citri pv. malvacearum]WAW93383.1 hypothetical protein LPY95_10785 [Xanthomonas citri pv. malvacearum]WAW97592.1 hypothetical protein LGM68_10820 [Xanthomonas citri pv. malvacearum]